MPRLKGHAAHLESPNCTFVASPPPNHCHSAVHQHTSGIIKLRAIQMTHKTPFYIKLTKSYANHSESVLVTLNTSQEDKKIIIQKAHDIRSPKLHPACETTVIRKKSESKLQRGPTFRKIPQRHPILLEKHYIVNRLG